MNATDKEKIDMNTTLTTNQRLVTVLLVLLIVPVALLVIGTGVGFLMMGGGMMGWGGMMNGGMTTACLDMMRNIQAP